MAHAVVAKASAVGVAVALVLTGVGCSDDDSVVTRGGGTTGTTTVAVEGALTVAELVTERPTSEVVVQGGVLAEGFEYFGEDEIGWVYDVELCQSVTVKEGRWGEEVHCEGKSVALTEDAMELDLEWQFADIGIQYAGDVVLRGTLGDDDVFEVIEVVDPGGEVEVDEAPLPMDELPGEDLLGLRRHLRTDGTVVIYLARHDFVSRVQQLRANCETRERLQDILDNLSSRGPEAPQDYVVQHAYVCPDLVEQLDLPQGVELPD
jgi:hypothetical protein